MVTDTHSDDIPANEMKFLVQMVETNRQKGLCFKVPKALYEIKGVS